MAPRFAGPCGQSPRRCPPVGGGGGNFGECAPVGDGVSEMKIHAGPGYRVYFTRVGDVIYVLLCGGSKSTQKADIRRAKAMAHQAGKD
jgi:putative addiction module killer protein